MKYLLPLLVMLVVFSSMCVSPNGVPPTPFDNETNSTLPNGTVIVEIPTISVPESMEIARDTCAERGIEGKVVVLHSASCGACAIAVPRLEELEAEFPGVEFEFLDLSRPEQRDRAIEEIRIVPYYVPTTIIDCYALVGVHPKETYKERIEAI